MYLGAGLIGLGIVWYIVYAIIYNLYLPKDLPDKIQESRNRDSSTKKKGRRKITVVLTQNPTPAWVALLGIPPVPLFLLGLVILIISALINLFAG